MNIPELVTFIDYLFVNKRGNLVIIFKKKILLKIVDEFVRNYTISIKANEQIIYEKEIVFITNENYSIEKLILYIHRINQQNNSEKIEIEPGNIAFFHNKQTKETESFIINPQKTPRKYYKKGGE